MKTKSTNPKDLLAAAEERVPLHLVPGTAVALSAMAHLHGAKKYGAYNWREEDVSACTYVAAIKRHLDDFLDGNDVTHDSGLHPLQHVSAGVHIMLDALVCGNLIDDRPPPAPTGQLHRALSKVCRSDTLDRALDSARFGDRRTFTGGGFMQDLAIIQAREALIVAQARGFNRDPLTAWRTYLTAAELARLSERAQDVADVVARGDCDFNPPLFGEKGGK